MKDLREKEAGRREKRRVFSFSGRPRSLFLRWKEKDGRRESEEMRGLGSAAAIGCFMLVGGYFFSDLTATSLGDWACDLLLPPKKEVERLNTLLSVLERLWPLLLSTGLEICWLYLLGGTRCDAGRPLGTSEIYGSGCGIGAEML